MTREEMDRVLHVISHADYGCTDCVGSLFEGLKRALPNHDWPSAAAEISSTSYGPTDTERHWAIVKRFGLEDALVKEQG